MIQKLLILCIGNICRSPIAEGLFADKLSITPGVSIQSAGLSALVGQPADPLSCLLMTERGLDISAHRARQVTQNLLFDADLILTMTRDQQEQVQANYPSSRGRVYRLGEWTGIDIVDPFQRPRVVFEQVMVLIEQSMDEWYEHLWA